MKAKYGDWTHLGPCKRNGTNKYLLCRCKCGAEKWVFQGNLLRGMSKSCGCSYLRKPGDKFGQLTIVKKDDSDSRKYICRCSCGNIKSIWATNLGNGGTISCGCLRKKLQLEAREKAISRQPEYRVWGTMFARCTNPNATGYARYGGRGIKICKRWRKYENFLRDMGKRPSPKHTIERIDNDGDYKPSNCKWATRRENMANRRNNRRLKYQGETLILSEWARRKDMAAYVLSKRLSRGWSIQRAIETPVQIKTAPSLASPPN